MPPFESALPCDRYRYILDVLAMGAEGSAALDSARFRFTIDAASSPNSMSFSRQILVSSGPGDECLLDGLDAGEGPCPSDSSLSSSAAVPGPSFAIPGDSAFGASYMSAEPTVP